ARTAPRVPKCKVLNRIVRPLDSIDDPCELPGSRRQPVRMNPREPAHSERSPPLTIGVRQGSDRSAPVWKTEGLVETKDSKLAERPDRPVVPRCQKCLSGILDQDYPMLVTPAPPPSCILRKPDIVDQQESPRPVAHQGFELTPVRRQELGALVEAAVKTGLGERLNLGAVVVRRDEDFVARG